MSLTMLPPGQFPIPNANKENILLFIPLSLTQTLPWIRSVSYYFYLSQEFYPYVAMNKVMIIAIDLHLTVQYVSATSDL